MQATDLRAKAALEKVLASIKGKNLRVLDIGCGAGHHARFMRETMGISSGFVTAIDNAITAQIHADEVRYGDFMKLSVSDDQELIWCSHVLEHLPNVRDALFKMHTLLSHDGWLVITVPPLKHSIVGGHVNLFNLGLLAYRLILAGFDCSQGHFLRDGYDISACVQKSAAVPQGVLDHLRHDQGDIDILAPYFPAEWHVRERFDGEGLPRVNWDHEGEIVKLQWGAP